MPIDPQIQPLVDLVNATAAGAPPLSEQTPTQRRDAYLALAVLTGPGPEVAVVEDGTIAGVPVRSYAEPDPEGVLVFFHGGGWVQGDLDTHDLACRHLALESGATVISVHYRLAPEHPFPAGIDDSWAVIEWLDQNRDAYGPDTRIAVAGDSAGGNFAAVLALMARDAGVDIAAQLLIYPSVDMLDDSPSLTENASGYILTRENIDWFIAHYAPDGEDWRASPLRADSHEGLAPATIITAEFDPLRDQGKAYADRLRAAGVPVELTNYDGQVHVFFQLGPYTDAGGRSIRQIARAARTALR